MNRLIIIFTFLSVLSNAALSNTFEHRKASLLEWLKTNPSYDKVLFIQKDTITCNTRHKLTEAYQYADSNGGRFNKNTIRSFGGCTTFQVWAVGRIIEKKPQSNVVKVGYRLMWNSGYSYDESYIPLSQLETYQSYLNRQKKYQ